MCLSLAVFRKRTSARVAQWQSRGLISPWSGVQLSPLALKHWNGSVPNRRRGRPRFLRHHQTEDEDENENENDQLISASSPIVVVLVVVVVLDFFAIYQTDDENDIRFGRSITLAKGQSQNGWP
jgi:hypothetical protein